MAQEEKKWSRTLSRSGYFLGALLLHLIVFIMVATWIIFPRWAPPDDNFDQAYVARPPPPPPAAAQQPTMPVKTQVIPNQTAAIRSTTATPTFSIPLPNVSQAIDSTRITQSVIAPAVKISTGLPSRLAGIKAFVQSSRENGNLDTRGDPRNLKTTPFPVYVASYANGDWSYNTYMSSDGTIMAGSLANLVEKINEWSHGNIKGQIMPKPLDIGGPDLLGKKPPFIYFTGHKDFVLKDQEIENLRSYLQNGGAIWGDNAMAGEGSRFDLAFHREMKRVVPDADKNFEPVPLTHEIFTKSWFPLTKLPSGINYYDEPIQHLDLDGKLAIVYTPNNYNDMMSIRILPGDADVDGSSPPAYKLYTDMAVWQNQRYFFRNIGLESCLNADKLGMNIIGYLLVRFDAEILLTP
jgi:hypothetical protein